MGNPPEPPIDSDMNSTPQGWIADRVRSPGAADVGDWERGFESTLIDGAATRCNWVMSVDIGAKDLEENLGWKAMDIAERHVVGRLERFCGEGVF